MAEALRRLAALCMLAALGEQLAAGSRLKDGVGMIFGLVLAGLILEAVLELPGALFG